jgi:orotate phosphoribosyltransferase
MERDWQRPRAGSSMPSTVSRPEFRRHVGFVAAGLVLTATSGCTVPVDAVAGTSAAGIPMAYET